MSSSSNSTCNSRSGSVSARAAECGIGVLAAASDPCWIVSFLSRRSPTPARVALLIGLLFSDLAVAQASKPAAAPTPWLLDFNRLWRPVTADSATRFTQVPAAPGAADEWREVFSATGPTIISRIWADRVTAGSIQLEIDDAAARVLTFAEFFGAGPAPHRPPLAFRLADEIAANSYTPLAAARWLKISLRGPAPLMTIQSHSTSPAEARQAAAEIARSFIAEIQAGLRDRTLEAADRILPIAVEQELANGALLTESLDGPGVIRSLQLALSEGAEPASPTALHRCVIRLFFDGAAEPQIESPVSEFFGGGFHRPAASTLVVGANRDVEIPLPDRRMATDQYMYCLLPMPFQNGFRFELLNYSGESLTFLLYLRVARREIPADALRLFARYRREFPCRRRLVPLFEFSPGARLVGLMVECDAMDEPWAVINHLTLRVPGASGTTLWNGGPLEFLGACADGPFQFQSPFQAAASSRAAGRAFAARWMAGDTIAAPAGLSLTVENRAANDAEPPMVAALACWYAPAGAATGVPRIQAADLEIPPLRIADAIEIEGRIRNNAGVLVAEKNARGVELSGQAAVKIEADRPVEIEIPSMEEREVELRIRTHPRQDFGKLEVKSKDNRSATTEFDRRLSGIYPLGRWKLTRGNNVVTVTTARPAILDCWIAE